jgi:nitrate reductase NapE component
MAGENDVTLESSAAEAEEPQLPGLPGGQSPLGPVKPHSNIYTFLLIIAVIFMVISIYLVGYELNKFYGVTFGGIVSAPVDESPEKTPPESPKK